MFLFLSNLWSAVSGVFGWAKQRDAERNTADQQANADATQVQKDRARAAADIASPKLDDLRRDVSE